MTSFNYKKWNIITGWVVFLIALITYWLTVEPTASFWDAGEYITTSSNLEVGHPPGAPLYQLLGAFFSIFALDPSKIAITINRMSVFASAFTILFMFWSLTYLLKKVISKHYKIDKIYSIAVIGSAAVGALSFAFTDSFWFNAVEAEVYAAAAFIMSLLFYLALRWENDMDKPRGNKWLIGIAFVVGLSFGIHFMGLLTIPAIGFLYFFKKYKTITVKNFIIANLVVVAILLFIFKLLLPMSLKFFSASELFFVNTIGLPFNSGTIIAGLFFAALFYFGIKYTHKKGLVHTNTLILCILFIFIGFSSWLMLPIRANAGVVINENNPNNARELLAYYNREQYPETHLFYGPMFTEKYVGLDPIHPYKDDKPKYEKDKKLGKYVIVNNYKNASQNLDNSQKGFFPRMWSADNSSNYLQFLDGLEFSVKRKYLNEPRLIEEVKKFKEAVRQGLVDTEDYDAFLSNYGAFLDIKRPSFIENIKFMLQYQFGYMYWRYFMWNFSGRQDDVQGQGTDLHGNWISGISFIDNLLLDTTENLPSDFKNNKARNTYFMLPLIFGILGIVFHYRNDPKSFWVLLVFFLFTGLALKIYLNERPFEPRERDYALVGSFYVFAMWIGFGAYALFDSLKNLVKPKIALVLALTVSFIASPVLLASQNWDDHDRSNRYTAKAMAKMYLDSCDPNAILFTIGDNDTFALWYLQGIEGYRRDVRVVNTSLFQTDWYIDDMKKKAYESDPIPSQLTHDKYRFGTRDFLFYQKTKKDTLDIKTWMNWVASDNPATKVELESNQWANTFPSKTIKIPVNKENVLKYNIVDKKDADKIVDAIYITINSEVIYKSTLLMLDIIANNDWKRPIYFSGGSYNDSDFLWLKDYLQLEGIIYKLVPVKTPVNKNNPFDMGRIDTDKMFNIVMKWDWGNSGSDAIYHDTETRRNGITYRSTLSRLAEALIKEGKFEKAEKILDLGMEKMPVNKFEYYSLLEPFIEGYYKINKPKKAREVFSQVAKIYQEHLLFYSGWDESKQISYAEDIISDMERYRGLVDLVIKYDTEEFAKKQAAKFNDYLKLFRAFYDEDEGVDVSNDTREREIDSLLNLLEDSIN